MHLSHFFLVLLPVIFCGTSLAREHDPRPPPPKSAPPLPPPERERQVRKKKKLLASCSVGAAGGCIGAFLGKRSNKSVQLAATTAIGSFAVASFGETLVRLFVALMNFLLRRRPQHHTVKEEIVVSSDGIKEQEENSWWPELRPVAELKSDTPKETTRIQEPLKDTTNLDPPRKKKKHSRADIVVEDVEAVPARKKKKLRLAFWKKEKVEEPPDEKPTLPPWSQAGQNQKNYVEDYGMR